MVIFHSYVSLPEGRGYLLTQKRDVVIQPINDNHVVFCSLKPMNICCFLFAWKMEDEVFDQLFTIGWMVYCKVPKFQSNPGGATSVVGHINLDVDTPRMFRKQLEVMANYGQLQLPSRTVDLRPHYFLW